MRIRRRSGSVSRHGVRRGERGTSTGRRLRAFACDDMLHAKVFSARSSARAAPDAAMVGSCNLKRRSFGQFAELNALIAQPSCTRQLRRELETLVGMSEEIFRGPVSGFRGAEGVRGNGSGRRGRGDDARARHDTRDAIRSVHKPRRLQKARVRAALGSSFPLLVRHHSPTMAVKVPSSSRRRVVLGDDDALAPGMPP